MSSTEVAVQVFNTLKNEDFRVLQVIEAAISKHESVPKELISQFTKFSIEETNFRLNRLHKLKLIRQIQSAYKGCQKHFAIFQAKILVKR